MTATANRASPPACQAQVAALNAYRLRLKRDGRQREALAVANCIRIVRRTAARSGVEAGE